ncbi:tail protein [Shigella phage vB_SflM_004]|nr:tail protein [Shigella phage vB_SflM_004]
MTVEDDTVYCEWLARVKPFSMLNAKFKNAITPPVLTEQLTKLMVSLKHSFFVLMVLVQLVISGRKVHQTSLEQPLQHILRMA